MSYDDDYENNYEFRRLNCKLNGSDQNVLKTWKKTFFRFPSHILNDTDPRTPVD